MLPSLAELQADLAVKSFRHFVKQGWAQVDPAPYLHNWHIDVIADHAQAMQAGEIRQLIVNIPPGFAKSLLLSVLWPAWLWLKRPADKLLTGSYASELAVRDSVKTRALLDTAWYQNLARHAHLAYGVPTWQLRADQDQKHWYINTQHGARIATSVGGKATGERADRIIVDDPLNALAGEFSEAARKEAAAWISGTLSTRYADPQTGTAIVVMQRLHEGDPTGVLLAQGGWDHLMLPMEYQRHFVMGGVKQDAKQRATKLGFVDPRQADGELLFAARYPADVVEKGKTALGPRASGQYQQNPVKAGGNMVQSTWFKRYSRLAPLPLFDRIGLSIDAAFEGKSTSDFVSLGVWGQIGPDHYLLDSRRGQWDFLETADAIRALILDWADLGDAAKLIEKKANGAALISTLKREFSGIIEITPTESKPVRLMACLHKFQGGNVYIPHEHEAPWVAPYELELTAFPSGLYDGQVDMPTQWLNWARDFGIHNPTVTVGDSSPLNTLIEGKLEEVF